MSLGTGSGPGRPLRLNPGDKVDRYEIVARLGEGAYGQVYSARDPTIGRVVALKLIPSEDAEGQSEGSKIFAREVRAAGALHHPHIVTLYDAGQDGGWYYLAMELIEGQTLASQLKEKGRLATERVVEIGISVAEALDVAHQRGVVHRDIKPANLMIDGDEKVKVADFGIARILSSGRGTMTTSAVVGTPHYMSPEQIRDDTIDGRADLYALGVVLYEATTGRKPFNGDTLTQLLSQILSATAKSPRTWNAEIPERLSLVIEKAMAKAPDARYARGKDLAEALRAVVGAAPATAPRRRLAGTIAAVALGALLGVGGFFAWQAVGARGTAATAPAKPGTAANGIVEFLSEPSGADVLVDGQVIGRTPYRKEMPAGQYEVEFRKQGFYPESATIQVEADARTPVDLSLTAMDRGEPR